VEHVNGLLLLGILLVSMWLFELGRRASRASKRKANMIQNEASTALESDGTELREKIIQRHLDALKESSGRYAAEDATRSTMRDIIFYEGVPTQAPREYLYRWRKRSGIRQEYKDLSTVVERRIRERLRSLEAERRATEESKGREDAEAIIAGNKETVEMFFKVAERKVATLDEYGDENWDALAAEVQRCVMKIGSREGLERADLLPLFDPKEMGAWRFNAPGMMRWRIVAESLGAEFRRRHAASTAPKDNDQDLLAMTPIEFETFVANMLKAKGFTSVRGTPVTGDQGADLIAEKDGRTIIIQAKRYQRPVGNKAVQEVIAARTFYKGDEAWVVTNSTFTPAAVALAQSASVRLVDGIELRKLTV